MLARSATAFAALLSANIATADPYASSCADLPAGSAWRTVCEEATTGICAGMEQGFQWMTEEGVKCFLYEYSVYAGDPVFGGTCAGMHNGGPVPEIGAPDLGAACSPGITLPAIIWEKPETAAVIGDVGFRTKVYITLPENSPIGCNLSSTSVRGGCTADVTLPNGINRFDGLCQCLPGENFSLTYDCRNEVFPSSASLISTRNLTCAPVELSILKPGSPDPNDPNLFYAPEQEHNVVNAFWLEIEGKHADECGIVGVTSLHSLEPGNFGCSYVDGTSDVQNGTKVIRKLYECSGAPVAAPSDVELPEILQIEYKCSATGGNGAPGSFATRTIKVQLGTKKPPRVNIKAVGGVAIPFENPMFWLNAPNPPVSASGFAVDTRALSALPFTGCSLSVKNGQGSCTVTSSADDMYGPSSDVYRRVETYSCTCNTNGLIDLVYRCANAQGATETWFVPDPEATNHPSAPLGVQAMCNVPPIGLAAGSCCDPGALEPAQMCQSGSYCGDFGDIADPGERLAAYAACNQAGFLAHCRP